MPDFVEFVEGANATPEGGTRVATFVNNGLDYQAVVPTKSDGTPVDLSLIATIAKQDSQIALETALNALITTIKNTVTTNDKTHLLLSQIRDAIAFPAYYVDATNSLNTTGTSTVTFATNQDIRTVTTVSTLTNQTNLGGYSADMIAENDSFIDWATSIRSLII